MCKLGSRKLVVSMLIQGFSFWCFGVMIWSQSAARVVGHTGAMVRGVDMGPV